MIIDRIENASLYRSLSPRLAAAMDLLIAGELAGRNDGRYELDGDRLFAMVQTYSTRGLDQCRWEAHRRYIDVQWIVSGCEQMGWADVTSLQLAEPYSEEKDVAFFTGQGSLVRASAGMFAIFFPHDAHMPCLADANPATVKKIVLKVHV